MKSIIFFGDTNPKTDLLITLYLYQDWDSYTDSDKTKDISGFYISASFNGNIHELLEKIRSSEYWYLPVYTEGTENNYLLDGQRTLIEAAKEFTFTQELLSKLTINIKALKKEEKLLLYLYLRENYELIPQFNAHAKKLYTYPLLDILAKDQENDWVYELTAKGLLSFSKLIDRVRLCHSCQSAHLYFVDLCPQCKSINIKESKILHCFSCGYVDEEKKFQKDTGLECPKCLTKLRLIGVDYDLPASQYKCYDCNYIFEEPQIIAKCMECQTQNEPDKLNTQEFHSIKLTLQGQEYLLLDQKNVIFSMFAKSLKHIKIDEFKLFLNWMISVFKRDNTFHFVVVLLEFDNMHEFIDYYGFSQTNEIMEELSRRILELLRETDMLSMDEEHRLWILLPTTSKKGIEERLMHVLDNLKLQKGPKLSVSLKTFYTTENALEENSEAKYIMEYLLQKKEKE